MGLSGTAFASTAASVATKAAAGSAAVEAAAAAGAKSGTLGLACTSSVGGHLADDVAAALSSTAVVKSIPVGRKAEPLPQGGLAATSRKTALLVKPEAPKHFEAIEDRFDRGNLINPDRLYPASTWASLTGREHFGASEGAHLARGEFHSKHRPDRTGMGEGSATLHAYRARWLAEAHPGGRDMRFTSENTRALGAPVAGKYRPGAVRVIAGATKGVEMLRDKATEAFGSEGVAVLLQHLPASFNLPQLRAVIGDAAPVGMSMRMSVDEGKSLWKQAEVAELVPVRRAVFAETLGPREETLPQVRRDAITAAWSLITALARASGSLLPPERSSTAGVAAGAGAGGRSVGFAGLHGTSSSSAAAAGGASGSGEAVPLSFLDSHCDYPAHRDVAARPPRATHGECRKRFLDGLAWIAAGEPPAPPVVLAAAVGGGSAAPPADAGDDDAAAAAVAARVAPEPPAGHGHADDGAGAGGGDDREGKGDAVSKWDVHYLPPRMAGIRISEQAFRRYCALVSAAIEDNDDFRGLLLAVWHLEEAVNLVPPEAMPPSMRPFILAAVARARGLPPPSAVMLEQARAGKAAEEAAAAAAAAQEAAKASMGGAAATASLQRGRTAAEVMSTGVSHLLLLVTHADGRRSLQRIACDRFLRRDDQRDLLTRLAAAGVPDAVAAELDF